jgi:hypothetical protein
MPIPVQEILEFVLVILRVAEIASTVTVADDELPTATE